MIQRLTFLYRAGAAPAIHSAGPLSTAATPRGASTRPAQPKGAVDGGRSNAVASGGLDGLFHFTKWGTTLRRDMLAGLTTFIVMSYIIFVNPSILGLGGKGLPFAAALTSTCLVAGVMTILMGAFTNRAYAIAPGMGLNAVVAFSLVLGQGLTFPQAMGLIFLEGVAITILVLTGFREAIFKAIPLELKKAIVVGIGFFILFIGLVDGGIVIAGKGTPSRSARSSASRCW